MTFSVGRGYTLLFQQVVGGRPGRDRDRPVAGWEASRRDTRPAHPSLEVSGLPDSPRVPPTDTHKFG